MGRKPTHGMSDTRTYHTWEGMVARCHNSRAPDFDRYGGRGITVCDRWRNFALFFADMGEAKPGLTIERIDGTKDYEPGNCRWATMKEQQRNRRGNRVLTIGGRSQCMSAWEEEQGLNKGVVKQRIRRGWTVERALDLA